MDNILRDILKSKIMGLKATAFQDAMDRIFLCIYGENKYQRVKQKHDGGSDGIVNSDTILAAYAPERYNLTDFKRKVGDDFKSYKKNWESSHGKWQVITNLEATAQMIKFVGNLKAGATIVCIDKLLQRIAEQTWSVKLDILRALDIPSHYLSVDLISTIIEDLIKISESDIKFPPYNKPVYIQDKIKANCSLDYQKQFSDEYEDALSIFPIISNILKSRSRLDVASIRSKIRNTYGSLAGSFEEKLNTMVNIMSQRNSSDDCYSGSMRIVIIYFFEQCLFGLRPSSEVDK